MSAFGGKADIDLRCRNVCFDPKRTFARGGARTSLTAQAGTYEELELTKLALIRERALRRVIESAWGTSTVVPDNARLS
jgi:hypothetical protein